MTQQQQKDKEHVTAEELAKRLGANNNPEIAETLARMRGPEDVPVMSADEIRDILDEALGDIRLTDILNEVKGK